MPMAYLWLDGKDIACRTPYDSNLVAALKVEFIGRARRWDPVSKLWKFDPPCHRRLVTFLQQHGYTVEDTTGIENHAAPTLTPEQEFLQVVMQFPAEVRHELFKRFYKAMALEAHPDRQGGDLRLMQTVNAAYERVR